MEIDLTRQSLALPIRESHDVGEARRRAMNICKSIGFDDAANGQIGIVTTELADNLVKHSGGGTLILRLLGVPSDESNDPCGLEILSLDNGPGMGVQDSLHGAPATGASPAGLSGVKGLASEFDLYSVPGKGTVICARVWARTAPQAIYDIGAICLPIAGERLCGDAWAVRPSRTGVDLVVSDGLGHGPLAAQTSDVALNVFRQNPDLPPQRALEAMHGAMGSTRGAAVMAVQIDFAGNSLASAGIGNIGGHIATASNLRGIASMDGIVGHQIRKVKAFNYGCAKDEVVILHSDGLTARWKLDEFPGLMSRSSSLIAGMLYKHYKRGKDDATVLVVRRS